MPVAGYQPPPFFKRGPAPVAKLIFFGVVSLLLLAVDQRYAYLEVLRQAVSLITYPIQRAALVPVEMLRGGAGYFSSLTATQSENESLKRRQVEASVTLLRADQLEQENLRLRALLQMRDRQQAKGLIAEILYSSRDPFSRKLVIDKGDQTGVAAGSLVVDERGVIGQITRVSPLTAELTLISDKNQAVPVQIVRNGLRAVAFGSGDGAMELRYLAANVDVKVGDILVTSGLDGVFLSGLPVARVAQVERDDVYAFARIVCEPLGAVESHRMVLVLGPRQDIPPPPDGGGPPRKAEASAHSNRATRAR